MCTRSRRISCALARSDGSKPMHFLHTSYTLDEQTSSVRGTSLRTQSWNKIWTGVKSSHTCLEVKSSINTHPSEKISPAVEMLFDSSNSGGWKPGVPLPVEFVLFTVPALVNILVRPKSARYTCIDVFSTYL